MTIATAISGSDCTIGYESIMKMDIIEISMIYDILCKRQERLDKQMKTK